MKITLKKGLAATAVAGLTLMGLTTQIAFAAGPETGSLTIHKYLKTTGNGTMDGDGSEIQAQDKPTKLGADAKVVEGVKFKVQKVKETGDLNTNDQWAKAAAIQTKFKTDHQAPATDKLEDIAENATKVDGVAAFSSLARGLYFVTESEVTGAKVDGAPAKVTKAEPFFVTIPLGTKFDVHVYPKNATFTVDKVADTTLLPDKKLSYTVTSTLPAKPAAGYEKYVLIDKLGTGLKANSFTLTEVKANDTSFEKDTDYTVENTASPVKVKFNSTGLGKLGQASDSGATTVVFKYTVELEDSYNGGQVKNQAFVVPGNEFSEEITGQTPPPSSETVTTPITGLKIKKIDGHDGATALQGATFNIYSCKAAGKYQNEARGDVTGVGEAKKWNKQILTSAETSGETSVVFVPGNQTFCIKEESAPSGYELLPEDTFVTSNNASADTLEIQTVTIKNYKSNFSFKLPKTGSSAIILLSVAGVAMVAGAFILRQRNANK